MKSGDLVKIFTCTMGVKIDTNTAGMIIRRSEYFIDFWDVLVYGKIQSINKNSLKNYSYNCLSKD
mgnify:CR=1 FL=1|jgi:hypothetical protein